MSYNVVVLEGAQLDIREIIDYMVNVLKSPKAASGFLDEFDRQVDLLKSNPALFAVSPIPELVAKDYRTAHIKNYLMLNAVREETVFIAHVFHQTQDYARLCNG